MTTKDSPLHTLKAEADQMAVMLKRAENGTLFDPIGKVAAARTRDSFKFVVAMDDKVLKIEMTWITIRETTEVGLSEYIVGKMRETSNTSH